jgi:hypothetical protein
MAEILTARAPSRMFLFSGFIIARAKVNQKHLMMGN